MKQLDSEQQRVMDKTYNAEYHKHPLDADWRTPALYAAGAALLEHEARKAGAWQEITPEHLPNLGDELFAHSVYKDARWDTVASFTKIHEMWRADDFTRCGWTHFRAINPPAPAEGAKGQPEKEPDGISMEEREGIAAGLADVAAGRVRPFEQIKAELTAEYTAPRAESQDAIEEGFAPFLWRGDGPLASMRVERFNQNISACWSAARRGYVKLEDVEKAIVAENDSIYLNNHRYSQQFAKSVLTRLTAQQGKETNHG